MGVTFGLILGILSYLFLNGFDGIDSILDPSELRKAAIWIIGSSWLGSCIVVTYQQTVSIISFLGAKFSHVLAAGIGFKLPFPFNTVVGAQSLEIVPLRETVQVKSSDNAFLTIPFTVNVQVDEKTADRAHYLLSNPEGQLMDYIQNALRSSASGMAMSAMFSDKETFKNAVNELKDDFAEFGYIIKSTLIDEPTPSKELQAQFEKVICAKREKEAAVMEAEAIKERKVGEAKAEAESLKLKSQAHADSRKILAEGNAESLRSFCEGTEIPHERALSYMENIDKCETIRDASSNPGNIVLVTNGTSSSGPESIAALVDALSTAKATH